MNKNVPNYISTFRLFLVPLFIYVYFSDLQHAKYIALAIFLVAGISDIIDGYIARKYQLVSKIGIVLDPLADKLMQLTAITCLAISGILPLWILVILYVKELVMILSGIYFYFHPGNVVVPANWYGKLATAGITIGVFFLIILPDATFSLVMIILAMLMKLLALGSYIVNYIRHIHPTMKKDA